MEKKKQRFLVDKLMRDHFLERIQPGGGVPTFQILGEDAYRKALGDKLMEEAQEVQGAQGTQEKIEELGDLLEVMQAIGRLEGISWEQVQAAQEQKKAARGGFEKRIYCKYVEVPQGHPFMPYYQSQPDRYPAMDPEDAVP